MTALEQRFGELGSSIEETIEAELERRVSRMLGQFATEVQLQLRPVLEQIEAERKLSDHRHKTVMGKLDDVVVGQRGNGKGGHGG